MKTSILISALLALLTGCAGGASKQYERLREYSGADAGVAVMSVGYFKSSPFSLSSIAFRTKETDDKGAFNYIPKYFFPSPKDFESTEAEGAVVALKLPPGQYEIFGALGGWGAGAYRFSAGTPILPPMAFTVQSGRTSYIGRFVIGFNGSRESPPANLQITDMLAADLAIANSRDKSVSTEPVQSFVPSLERRKQ